MTSQIRTQRDAQDSPSGGRLTSVACVSKDDKRSLRLRNDLKKLVAGKVCHNRPWASGKDCLHRRVLNVAGISLELCLHSPDKRQPRMVYVQRVLNKKIPIERIGEPRQGGKLPLESFRVSLPNFSIG